MNCEAIQQAPFERGPATVCAPVGCQDATQTLQSPPGALKRRMRPAYGEDMLCPTAIHMGASKGPA